MHVQTQGYQISYKANSHCEVQEYLSATSSCEDKALKRTDGYICQYMWKLGLKEIANCRSLTFSKAKKGANTYNHISNEY